jgi:hypothetical protein
MVVGLELDLGTFILFYMCRRIANDQPYSNWQLEWREAPYCLEDRPPSSWLNIEKAARIVESENRPLFDELLLTSNNTPIGYKLFLDNLNTHFEEATQEWGKQLSTLLAVSMIGRYGRILAEADATLDDGRRYRLEMHQVSLFGYLTLNRKWAGRTMGNWLSIENESVQLVAHWEKKKKNNNIIDNPALMNTLKIVVFTGGIFSLAYFIYRRFV